MNNYLIDNWVRSNVGLKAEARVGPQSGLREPKEAKPSILETSLPYVVALPKAKSLLSLLGTTYMKGFLTNDHFGIK